MKQLLFFVFCFGFLACSNESEKNGSTQKKPVKPKKVESVDANKPIWLSDDNCVDFLTQYGKKNTETRIRVITSSGNIDIELYNNTPLHRASMIYLVKEKQYFNGTLFYRVVKDFIAQAGQRDDEHTQEKRFLIGKYTIPAEILPEYFHKVGAVAMARNYSDNPSKRSSPYDFFIITGKQQSDFGLDMTEKEYGVTISGIKRETYMKNGGAPHLDGEHTIIGRVIKGLDVAKKISSQETDGSDWPKINIPLTVELID